MRKIKFRFWDLTLKKMCYRKPLTNDFSVKDIIPLQSTGFKDKNGIALSIADVMAMLPTVTYLEKVNRVEVIDQKGRSYVNWKPTNKTELSLQDDGKTLKVFISN